MYFSAATMILCAEHSAAINSRRCECVGGGRKASRPRGRIRIANCFRAGTFPARSTTRTNHPQTTQPDAAFERSRFRNKGRPLGSTCRTPSICAQGALDVAENRPCGIAFLIAFYEAKRGGRRDLSHGRD